MSAAWAFIDGVQDLVGQGVVEVGPGSGFSIGGVPVQVGL
jgi:hypothetical protein